MKAVCLHGAPYAVAPTQQTHIPMLMWFSTVVWKNQAKQQVKCLAQQGRQQELSQDNLFPTMLEPARCEKQGDRPEQRYAGSMS